MLWHLEIAEAAYALMVLKHSVARIHLRKTQALRGQFAVMVAAVIIMIVLAECASPNTTAWVYCIIVFLVGFLVLPIVGGMLIRYYCYSSKCMQGNQISLLSPIAYVVVVVVVVPGITHF